LYVDYIININILYNMSLLVIFANNVKKYRLEKGLSQEELGFLSNLHRTYISDIERCKRSISLKNIELIATALDIEPYRLFVSNEE